MRLQLQTPILRVLFLLTALAAAGCGGEQAEPELVWGRRGLQDGDFVRPRAITLDARPGVDELYIVDFTGRIQGFDRDGPSRRGWATPDIAKGRPAGLTLARDGNLVVG